MRRKSLLAKTLMQFAACTAAIFVLTAPLFYRLTKRFYAEDMINIIEAVERGENIPPLDLERDIMEGMMLQFLLIFMVVSLALFITIRFITRRLWLPFDDTLRKAEQFNLMQNSLPQFIPTDISEFQRLNATLHTLMSKDREAFRMQKEFTENASHELQTPLAVIRSKLDLLMQEHLTERQANIIGDLYALTTRMTHLNRNLLLLAKIDNAQFAAKEEADVAAMIASLLPLYSLLQNGIPVNVVDLRTDRQARIRANAALLDCLLKNLIVNAIRNCPPDGTVDIRIEDSRLTVSNTAKDNTPLDASSLFQRFRSSDARGNGLGLAIVKAICRLHGWAAEYSFHGGRHHFQINVESDESLMFRV